MSKREMLSLMIKLVGVYCLVQLVPGVLQSITIAVTEVFKPSQPSWIAALGLSAVMMISPLLWIALCIWVIRQSDRFAARLYPVDAPAGQFTTLGIKDIQKLGYHFIGLTLIVNTLPAMVMAVYRIFAEQGAFATVFPLFPVNLTGNSACHRAGFVPLTLKHRQPLG